jgi:SAM-dependent methyltransferase
MANQAIKKLLASIKQQGTLPTIVLVLKNLRFYFRHKLDRRFDIKHRVDTVGSINLEDLSFNSDSKVHGVYYEPTPKRVFYNILSGLNIDHREFEFVDLGCGKGRVLFMAARFPFRKITGVEFSPELAEVATRNIETSTDEHQQCKNLEILCLDAAQYRIPESKTIIYLFNPFYPAIMEVVAQNLAASFKRSPTKKIIIYYHPLSMHIFEKLPFLKKIAAAKKVIDLTTPHLRGYTVFETIDDWSGDSSAEKPEPSGGAA